MTLNILDIMRNQVNIENSNRDGDGYGDGYGEVEMHGDVYALLALAILHVLYSRYDQFFVMPTMHGMITTSGGTEMDFSAYSCAGTDYFTPGRITVLLFMFSLASLQICKARMKIMVCAPVLGKVCILAVMYCLSCFILVTSLVYRTADGDGGCMHLHPQQWMEVRGASDEGGGDRGLWKMIQNHNVAYSGLDEPGNTVSINSMIDMFVMNDNSTSSTDVIEIRLKLGKVKEDMWDNSELSFFGIWLFAINFSPFFITIAAGMKAYRAAERNQRTTQRRVVPLDVEPGSDRERDEWGELDPDPAAPGDTIIGSATLVDSVTVIGSTTINGSLYVGGADPAGDDPVRSDHAGSDHAGSGHAGAAAPSGSDPAEPAGFVEHGAYYSRSGSSVSIEEGLRGGEAV